MSHHVSGRVVKSAAALIAVLMAATALSGCAATAGRAFGDPMVTGSTGRSNGAGNLNQPMPSNLGATTRVAGGPFIPPENVGGGLSGNAGGQFNAGTVTMIPGEGRANSVSSQDLPTLDSATPLGPQQTMAAQQSLAPVTVSNQAVSTSSAASPNLTVVPTSGYGHTIQSGESLYTIARRYNVTTQAIVQANNLSSPDKIVVGQKVIIPGRPDLHAGNAPTSTEGSDVTQSPVVTQTASNGNGGAITDAKLLQSNVQPQPQIRAGGTTQTRAQANQQQPVSQAQQQPQQEQQQQREASVDAAQQQPVKMPLQEPAVSGADKFRWPASGRVITDFASSKGTGINIEVQEGASVKAAENGTVIYVGNGVEGYGNMILIRHANGYVSAYAHLKDAKVSKGATVARGDTIGAAGMTGSVSRPQLHFELRKGATPVDPIPLLAS